MTQSKHCNTVGQIYHQFKVVKVQDIHELHCQLIELVHIPTGAHVLHIANDDPENLFCLSFKTIPTTSNGVAHILEHTVLCGSEKFPVKDPFFAMQKRSLNTFMNALTGSDFTCYPASSQVPKDLYNLLEVYLDAVFHPNINELSFLQEGHRLEFADPSDPTSDLEYKGIVFNEMKGALIGPSSRLSESIGKALFPDLTYGINSGGDPKVIPSLTYQQLCDFHKEFYNPSRCLFFFYGNLPLEPHLDFIATHILDQAEPAPPLPPTKLQPRFTEPRYFVEEYPIAANEDIKDKTLIAFAWLTCHILEQQELLALTILELILMDNDASPLKMALLKSGLCKQVSGYMEDEISEVPVVLTLKGCNPENADKIQTLIYDTLKAFIANGVPLDQFENAIHQLEFHRSEITGNSAPFGLSLFMRSALLKQHGGNPADGLMIHSLFDEIRRRNLADPNYLTDILEKHFIKNTHFIRILLTPSKELAEKELQEEKATLAAIKEKLTPTEKQHIIDQAAKLVEFQEKQEEADFGILPTVTLKDVPHSPRTYPLIQEKAGLINVFHHNCFTNEIVYADLAFNLPPIPEEDLPYVRLLTTLLGQLGCGDRSYAKNLEYIQANTGGIGSYLSMNLQAKDHSQFYPALHIRSTALHRKSDKLFALMKETAVTIDFTDIGRLKEIILKQYTGLQSSLNQNALKYAINLSANGLDICCKISNKIYGLDYFWMMKRLAQNFDVEAEALISKLKHIHSLILKQNTPDLVITCDAEMFNLIKGHHYYGIQELEHEVSPLWQPNYPSGKSYPQGRIISSPVAFTSQVIKTCSYIHPDAAALNIASFLFDNLTLHTSLREQGGAYGGGAVNNSMAGNFYFYSYRDPNIASTLEAFEKSIKNILNGNFNNEDIEAAILEMMQTLDAPIAPGSRGDSAYGWLREGKTTEIRQAFRDRILHLTQDDIITAVNNQLVPNLKSAAVVSFASQELLEKENGKLTAEKKPPLPIETI